ncbi:MAG: hypothetical protein E6Q97_20240 [Desulfurellales bacterium]|nr:MAG: hypothetical protein E6Q97_20240 [Desulfurellales bacterium]
MPPRKNTTAASPAKPTKRVTLSYAERFQRKLDLVGNILAIDVKEAAAQLPNHAWLMKFAADAAALSASWSALRNAPELRTLTGRLRSHGSAVPGQLFRLSGSSLRRAQVLHGKEVAAGPWRLDRVADEYYVLSSTLRPEAIEAAPHRNAARDKGAKS